MIPVVFLQVWKKANVDVAIRKASMTNTVHLIGDKDYSNGACEFHDISKWSGFIKDWISFQGMGKVDDFETLCLYRWICILKLMEKIGCDKVWACDSDVLVYANADVEYARVGSPPMTFAICPEGTERIPGWSLGHAGHSVVSRAVLEKFVRYKAAPDSWNDMFAWSIFIRENGVQYVDTSQPANGRVWDHHLGNHLKKYRRGRTLKNVEFSNGMPVVTHDDLGRLVTPVLHCWGDAEALMPQLADCKPI